MFGWALGTCLGVLLLGYLTFAVGAVLAVLDHAAASRYAVRFSFWAIVLGTMGTGVLLLSWAILQIERHAT